MATEQTREREPSPPLREGEFQRIPGIGPGIAQRLHSAGIQTFLHLASLTPEEICGLLNGLVGMTAERIAHQDWPGKARQFAGEIAAADPSSEPEDPGKRQHYASFMVELLQDENYVVRRTRVVHVQTNTKESWAGWDATRFDRWITTQAAISPAPPVPETVSSESALPEPALPEPIQPEPVLTDASPSMVKQGSEAGAPALQVGNCEINLPNHKGSTRFLVADWPFEIRIPINFEEGRPQAKLLYQATAYLQPLGGERFQAAEVSGLCAGQGTTKLVLPIKGLDEGTYRLETLLLVYPENAAPPEKEGQYAFSEGMRLYIISQESEVNN